MKHIKVTHCISTIDKKEGGPSRSVPNLCKGLSELDIHVSLLTYDTPEKNDMMLVKAGVELIYIAQEHHLAPFNLNIKKYLPRLQTQILHTHGVWLPMYHWISEHAYKMAVPLVVSPRGSLEPWCVNEKRIKKQLSMLLYQRKDIQQASCLCATSEMEAHNLRDLGFKNPVAIIPNGIDLTQYPIKNDTNSEKSIKNMLFLSRIHPKKGLELLLQSYTNLPIELKEKWRLMIVGNGEQSYVNSLKSTIREYQLENFVSVKDPVFGKEKIALYHNTDLFVLPSYSENFGMVIAEALACGVPVVTTQNTPWKSIETSNSGWWIELSVENLTATLSHAMKLQTNQLMDMGKNGRLLIEREFTIESVSKKTAQLYRWLLRESEKPFFVI